MSEGIKDGDGPDGPGGAGGAGGVDGDPITDLLRLARAGDSVAAERAFSLVVDRLRRIAASYARNCRPGETLTTTSLVGEAYIRLFGGHGMAWNDRVHFFRVAARAMRSIVVDHARARARRATARGDGGIDRNELDAVVNSFEKKVDDLIELDRALEELGRVDERLAQVVELRFFAGLSVADVAKTLDSSLRTTERDLELARRWLEARVNGRRDLKGS